MNFFFYSCTNHKLIYQAFLKLICMRFIMFCMNEFYLLVNNYYQIKRQINWVKLFFLIMRYFDNDLTIVTDNILINS